VVPFKVRRRAQAVRLAAQGWTAPRIARHLGLDRTTLHRDLRRWPERGIEGLGQRSYLEDGKPPGARPRWTPAMSAFLRELLAGEEAWTAGDGVPVGHAKAYVLTDPVRAHGEAHGGGEGEVCGRPGGGGKGGLRVFFLAALRSKHRTESGFGLSLPPTYAWARQGEAVRVPRAWGKSGRVNAVAHLERRSCGGWGLGYALLEGRCGTGEVVAYLEGLSREVAREGVRGVVFLDHAPFHRSRGFREAVERWRGRGLEVAYLPRYSPHLNPVET
jgi:putative transposase